MTEKPVLRVLPSEMKNSRYSVSVWAYLMGQYRIQIEDHRNPTMAPEGHGDVVVELDTYKEDVLDRIVHDLKSAEDPVSHAEELRKPWNSEHPRDRIRLDNTSEAHTK